MKLVKFKDGQYGIRKWRIMYYDLDCPEARLWWSRWCSYFLQCCRADKETAIKYFDILTDAGRPVKDDK